MTRVDSVRIRAQRRLQKLSRYRRDPRFRRTVSRLVDAGLLETNEAETATVRGSVVLADALWAGEVEPRILELLPAIVLKQPRLFTLPKSLPEDLDAVVRAIRRGRDYPSFRVVEPRAYLPWVERIGSKGKVPTTLRAFRLRPDDLARLHALKESLPAASETEVIRLALRRLALDSARPGAGRR